jgi:acyl-CoA thioesterase
VTTSQTSHVEAASAVSQVADGLYTTELDGDWSIGNAMNGGYLQLPLVRAVLAESALPHPIAVTTDFLAPPVGGTASIEVERLREGRSAGTYRAVLRQDGKQLLTASVVTGMLTEDAAPEATTFTVPEIPAPEECFRVPADTGTGVRVGLLDHVEVLLSPESGTALAGDRSLRLTGWFRAGQDVEPDPLLCVLGCDAFAPVTFTLGTYGWAPTVQLSTYLRALPVPGWLRVEVTGAMVADGWFDEECAMYDSAGRLVAQSRQIARTPRG